MQNPHAKISAGPPPSSRFDITLAPFDLAKAKTLFANGEAALPEADILLPEGTSDADRWCWAVRDLGHGLG